MRTYQVEVFINEQPQQILTFETWRPWTAVQRAANTYKDELKKTNRKNQKITFRCIRLA